MLFSAMSTVKNELGSLELSFISQVRHQHPDHVSRMALRFYLASQFASKRLELISVVPELYGLAPVSLLNALSEIELRILNFLLREDQELDSGQIGLATYPNLIASHVRAALESLQCRGLVSVRSEQGTLLYRAVPSALCLARA